MIETEEIEKIREEVEKANIYIKRLLEEMRKVIVGQEEVLDKLIIALLTKGHVLLEGVPGIAKTLMAKTLAETLDLSFKRIQFTPDMLPSDIIGTIIYNQKTGEFITKKGPVFTNILLADEINRTPPKVQSALLQAMQELEVTIGDNTFQLPLPFMVIATQNPIEQEGTYPLPEAQLDRFEMKILVNYPKPEEEIEIMKRWGTAEKIPVEKVVSKEELIGIQELVKKIYVDEKIHKYIVDIVNATRNPSKYKIGKELIRYGVSPRASLFLLRSAKAVAFLNTRAFVIPDDIKYIAKDILRHRIILSFEAEAEGITTDEIIERILKEVPVP